MRLDPEAAGIVARSRKEHGDDIADVIRDYISPPPPPEPVVRPPVVREPEPVEDERVVIGRAMAARSAFQEGRIRS